MIKDLNKLQETVTIPKLQYKTMQKQILLRLKQKLEVVAKMNEIGLEAASLHHISKGNLYIKEIIAFIIHVICMVSSVWCW